MSNRTTRWLALPLVGAIAAGSIILSGSLTSAQTPGPGSTGTPTPEPGATGTPSSSGSGQSYDAILAEELGIGVEELRDAQSNARDRYFNELVESGDLTQAEAADLKASSPGEIAARALDSSELDMLREFALTQVASVMEMEPAELERQLDEGKSLSEIAEEQGISEQDIRNEIQGGVEQLIDLAVQAGLIDGVDAEELKQNARDFLDSTFEGQSGGEATPSPTVATP